MVTILSLATACVMDAALGPYAGKQTGEPALLRELFGRLGDTEEYTKEEIAELYGFRWNVEVYQADCPSSAGLYQLAA